MNKVLFSVLMLMTFSLSCMANEQKSLGPCGCGYATCSLPSDLKKIISCYYMIDRNGIETICIYPNTNNINKK